MADQLKIIQDTLAKDLKSKFAPDSETNIRNKYGGYNLIFYFPTCPVESEKAIAFPAYIKKISDSFSPKYQTTEVYGRMDPIPVYSRTSRTIQFDLDLPSFGLAHSREIADKLNILVKNLYPSYEKSGNLRIISSPPLVRIAFSNLIKSTITNGSLLGYFASAINITHDLEKGVFAREAGLEVYPRAYSLSFSFNVLHDYTPGYTSEGTTITNPLNILGRGPKPTT